MSLSFSFKKKKKIKDGSVRPFCVRMCLFLHCSYNKDMSSVFVCKGRPICLQFSYARAGLSSVRHPFSCAKAGASSVCLRFLYARASLSVASLFACYGQVCLTFQCSCAKGRSVSPFSVRVLRAAPFSVCMPRAGFLSLQSAHN